MLYAGSIAWVIGYDTIYAHQDAEDDALIGIKSTALLFGERTHPALAVFYALAVVLIGVALALAGARLAGLDRACRVRRASGLADPRGSTSTIRRCACGCSSPTAMRGCCCLRGCWRCGDADA